MDHFRIVAANLWEIEIINQIHEIFKILAISHHESLLQNKNNTFVR